MNLQHILVYFIMAAAVLPAAGQTYDFTASSTVGCTPFKVKYAFLSTASVDSVSGYLWDFGNGETSTLQDPDSVTYEVSGNFTPNLQLTFNQGYDSMLIKTDMITVHRTVPAIFSYYDSVSYNVYVFEHTEPLETGINYTFTWDIETFPLRYGPRQVVTFGTMDTFRVTLTVADDLGCTSTTSQDILVVEDISVQNVFTPNNDGINDFFMITSNGGFPISLRIFTRAGILVYSTEGTTLTWDGRTASGQELNPGIYFYTIESLSGDPHKRYSKAGVLYMYK
jgi:gliding motility-associated-like protein